MTRRSLTWPAAILLSTAAVSVVTYAGIWPSARPVVAVPFLVLCPGLAWARLLRVDNEVNTVMLGVALSLAIDTIVSTEIGRSTRLNSSHQSTSRMPSSA